jgi:hypothetical protein
MWGKSYKRYFLLSYGANRFFDELSYAGLSS